jgi:glycosyltransferase involved in cell wall biosynthesis
MKILFIAPLPPPINGQSLQSKLLYDFLIIENEIILIDTMKNSHKDGIDSFKRVINIIKILYKIIININKVDTIYLQISESFAGNIRDLFIFIIGYKKANRTYLHLHGGSIKKWVYDKSKFIFLLNKFFIKRMAGIIVLGKSHVSIFNKMIDEGKVNIVHNFAEDLYFTTLEQIKVKFSNLDKIRVLFLSNMILGKGHNELLDGYLSLNEDFKNKIQIDFAGAFSNNLEKAAFLKKIGNHANIHYHGVVAGKEKKLLLENAHVLCFPSYLFEGQGICLIEGYASGCVGMTTGKSGIKDIFIDKINGFKIEEKSPQSIKAVLEEILNKKHVLLNIGQNNFYEAIQKYSLTNHCNKINALLLNINN